MVIFRIYQMLLQLDDKSDNAIFTFLKNNLECKKIDLTNCIHVSLDDYKKVYYYNNNIFKLYKAINIFDKLTEIYYLNFYLQSYFNLDILQTYTINEINYIVYIQPFHKKIETVNNIKNKILISKKLKNLMNKINFNEKYDSKLTKTCQFHSMQFSNNKNLIYDLKYSNLTLDGNDIFIYDANLDFI